MKSCVSCSALLIPAILFLAATQGCATTKAKPPEKAALLGMIYDESRAPVQDVKVSLVDAAGDASSVLSDIRGHYAFPGIPFGYTTLIVEKDGYESSVVKLTFSGPTQVVYTRISSKDELLDDAVSAIKAREWASATSLLARIRTIQPDDKVADFLDAQVLALQGKSSEAADKLESLASSGTPSFAVELALADLYQYALSENDKALQHLKKTLEIKDDIDVEDRIAALQKQ